MHLMRSWIVAPWARVLSWLIPVAATLSLAFVLLRERRQARSLAARSRELERLSSELIRVNRMKSEFLANVSHELRTPLNAIVGFVDLLREGVYGELTSKQVKPVERIEASANHLRQLVDQVLDLARIAAGRLELHPELVDLRRLLLDVASEVESLAAEKQLAFTLALGTSLPKVRTDALHLQQILMNLLGNAIKYTPTGKGSVTLRTRLATDPGWVAIDIADTGIGIHPIDHSRIFEEFEQVNAGPRSDSARRGTGLGLAISKRLCQALGGRIELESAPGVGSTFTLWLPAEPELLTAEQSLELAEHPGLFHG
jgi:signal transduction histidine kinase